MLKIKCNNKIIYNVYKSNKTSELLIIWHLFKNNIIFQHFLMFLFYNINYQLTNTNYKYFI